MRGFESWLKEGATKSNRIMQDDAALLRISNGVRLFYIPTLGVAKMELIV